MREMFSDKQWMQSKLRPASGWLLAIVLLLFFVPLMVLAFYNHPSADDYISGTWLRESGFLAYQERVYNSWGGRFASTFAGSLFVIHDYLYDHYFLHTVILLFLNLVSALVLVQKINRYVFAGDLTTFQSILFAFVFVALTICCMPQASTYLFWFSSSITYQLPVVLLQLEIAAIISLVSNNKNSLLKGLIVTALIFILNGFNEVFFIIQAVVIAGLIILDLLPAGIKWWKWLFVIFFIASALIVITAPGNAERAANIEPKGFVTGLAATCYHFLEVLWNAFSSVIFWVCCFAAFLYGNFKKQLFLDVDLVKKIKRKRWVLPVVIILFTLSSSALAVFGLKGGLVPDRYVNIVVYGFVVLCLLMTFTEGIFAEINFAAMFSSSSVMLSWLCFSLSIAMCCNTMFISTCSSFVTAPAYDVIMQQREDELKNAAHTSVQLPSYNNAVQQLLETRYAHSTKTLQQMLLQKPPLIFFNDDLSSDYSKNILQKFYGVDSIVVK